MEVLPELLGGKDFLVVIVVELAAPRAVPLLLIFRGISDGPPLAAMVAQEVGEVFDNPNHSTP